MNPKFEVDTLAKLVDKALAGAEGNQALWALERENEILKERFSRNPGMAFNGELFEIADLLTQYASNLATEFGKRGENQKEEQAWKLRYSCLQTAYSYRKNVVGPALLDWANCNKRIGNQERSDEIFDSIIQSLAEVLPWGPSFDPDWLLTVDCLQQALLSSSRDYGDLESRTRQALKESRRLAQLRSDTAKVEDV